MQLTPDYGFKLAVLATIGLVFMWFGLWAAEILRKGTFKMKTRA
jgi:hypothetical protein